MKLLYYLPAIGYPNLDKKYNILLHNLNYIYNNIKQNFSISINFYDISEEIKKTLKDLLFIDTVYIYEKPGILTELFLTNPNNIFISKYDYILFILDDVKIIDIDILAMISIKKQNKIEFLSPKITNSTHSYMNTNHGLTITNFLEVYLLLLEPKNLLKFFSIHSLENKHMWGVDFMYWYYKIRTGIINDYTANHELPSKSNAKMAEELCNKYLIKATNGKYNNVYEIMATIPAICAIPSQSNSNYQIVKYNNKCKRKECKFLTHLNINNNGGTHCCLSCKNIGTHGPACARLLID
jgi:hypothetical protein